MTFEHGLGSDSTGIEWGVAQRNFPGQEVCGDLYVVKEVPQGILVAAIDGIGHGDEAAEAARKAAEFVEQHAEDSLVSIILRCHEELRYTRGVVMSLALIDSASDTVSWLGVGNVEAVLFSAGRPTRAAAGSIPLRGGVIGGRLPRLSVSTFPVAPGDVLIFATDGISNSFIDSISTIGPIQQLTERVFEQHIKENDDALLLAVRYLGRSR